MSTKEVVISLFILFAMIETALIVVFFVIVLAAFLVFLFIG